MKRFLEAWLGPRRFTLRLIAAFAMAAVLLAVSGLYGLVAYAVSQRAPEIGLRMAVGATHGHVQRMILRQAAGLAVGGAAAGTAALLVGVALFAAWPPARRAARIDPTLALRAQ